MADAAAASLPSSSPAPSFCDGLRPAAAMVGVQSVLAGVNIFYKLATSDGMPAAVLVAYRFLFGAVVLCPVAYFLERKKRPRMTWMVLVHAFFSGLFGGTLVQNLYVVGLKLTSVTFATATINLGPAMTFVLAVAFRLEKAGLRTAAGHLKLAGTAVAVSGAMVLTLYKGTELSLWSSSVNLLDRYHAKSTAAAAAAGGHDRLLGSLLCVGSCLSYSLWLILQAKMGHYFPCPYSSTALMCVMGALQAVVYALIIERGNTVAWRLGFDVRMLTVVYNGVLASAVTVTVLAWVINKKGPLYASVFNPLMLVISSILGSFLLGEKLHLGSVLGAALIILGLYLVLWGKRREAGAAKVTDRENLPTTSQETPRGGCSVVPSSRFSLVVDCVHLGPENMLQFWGEEEITRAAVAILADVEDEPDQPMRDPTLEEVESDIHKEGKQKDDIV